MPILPLILEALASFVGIAIRSFTLLRGLLTNVLMLIKAFWPKIIAVLTAVAPFFIDRLLEAGTDLAVSFVDSATEKVNTAQTLPFPNIPTLSSAYYALDPTFRSWLDMFRVSESLAIIASVISWKYGKDFVGKIIGRFL